MRKYILFVIFTFLSLLCLAREVSLEPITVAKTTPVSFAESVEYLGHNFVNPPFFSPEDILDYSSSLDLKRACLGGGLQDVSLRACGFEDVSLNFAGISLHDPQTGHYNLEIPLTSADLDILEVSKNRQKIGVVLKKPEETSGVLETSFGEHAFWGELLSANFSLLDFRNRLSAEHKSSSGSRQDTDFDIYNFSFHSLKETERDELEFIFAASQRKLGVADFYALSFPHEEENTTQRFLLLRLGHEYDRMRWENTAYWRRHSDKFLLDRQRPSFYVNDHTTYIYGYNSDVVWDNNLSLSLRMEREKIDSTNLDKHRRFKKGVSFGIKDKKIGDFFLDVDAGSDYYQEWGWLDSSHFSLGYALDEAWRARFCFDRVWRLPSFTELYYLSPANIGNSGLAAQKSNNFECGMDYTDKAICGLSLNFFRKQQSATIDWVKDASSAAWEACNVGRLSVYGCDFYLSREFNGDFWDSASLSYTYTNLDKSSPYRFSKYVFNYNRHKLVAAVNVNLGSFQLGLVGNFSKPVDRVQYTTLDFKLTRKFSLFDWGLEGVNLLNTGFWEAEGIKGQGRWIKTFVRYNF